MQFCSPQVGWVWGKTKLIEKGTCTITALPGGEGSSQMCQWSRWSSLCPLGSGAEGWDLFFFVSEKWLCPSCAGAGAGVAAKVLPARGAGPTHPLFLEHLDSDLCLGGRIYLNFLFKSGKNVLDPFQDLCISCKLRLARKETAWH